MIIDSGGGGGGGASAIVQTMGTATCTWACGTSGTVTVNSDNTLTWVKTNRTVTVVGLIGVASIAAPVGTLSLVPTGLPAQLTGIPARHSIMMVARTLAATSNYHGATRANNGTILVYTRITAGDPVSDASDVTGAGLADFNFMWSYVSAS